MRQKTGRRLSQLKVPIVVIFLYVHQGYWDLTHNRINITSTSTDICSQWLIDIHKLISFILYNITKY